MKNLLNFSEITCLRRAKWQVREINSTIKELKLSGGENLEKQIEALSETKSQICKKWGLSNEYER